MTEPSPSILAAIFVSPAFALGGLALVSVPIIIHLLNRRRFKLVNWAAMSFLLAAMKKNRRRLQFEQWLLLATRCGLLALLGVALARPVACGDSALTAGATRSGLHVLVIDNSYSMAYEANRPGAATHLDQARKLAKATVESLSSGGEAVAIVTAARPAKLVLPATYDLAAAAAAIDRVDQSAAGTDLAGALSSALELGQQNARVPFRRLVLLTDSTRSAWESSDREELARLGPELAKVFRIRHHNLARPDQWNAAVLDVSPAARLIRTGFDTNLLATVRAFGRSADAAVQWSFDNRPLPGGTSVNVASDTPPITQSQARFAEGGAHAVTVGAPGGDRLRLDDVRHRVVEVASAMRVLIVEGERGVGPLAGSAAFLELALAPPTDAGAPGGASMRRSSSYVVPELISDLELGNKVLGDYRAVILAGVGQLAPAQGEQLKRFVEDGGTLILFMGEPVAGENYNQVLLPRGLLPGALVKRVSVTADQKGFTFDFNPHGSLHPLLRIFSGEENSGLETAQVFTYWQMQLPGDTKAERVLDFAARGDTSSSPGGRDPAVTLHAAGNGRVVFVATTANAEWTSFPAKPAYVALMHEMLAGSVSAGDAWMNVAVGDAVQLPPTLPLTAQPTLRDASQQEIPLQQATRPDGRPAYRSPPIARPGLYTLTTGAATVPIAVNPPADEADIRPLDDRGLRAALGGVEAEFLDDSPPVATNAAQAGRDFGWMVMLLVFGLVGIESLMAMQFGHYRR